MPLKIKAIVIVIENIGIILFGIANIFAGAYLWGFHPFLAVAAYAASLTCIVRGVSGLLEKLLTRSKS